MRQGGYESLVSYRKRHDAALKVYIDQKNPDIDDMDQAMDFFDGLDNAQYTQFKTDIHNAMTSKTMAPPVDVNTVYDMACNWVKTQSVQRQGTSTTFVTTLDTPVTKTANTGKKQEAEKTGASSQDERLRVIRRTLNALPARKRGIMRTNVRKGRKQGKNQTKMMITYAPCMPHACSMHARLSSTHLPLNNFTTILQLPSISNKSYLFLQLLNKNYINYCNIVKKWL